MSQEWKLVPVEPTREMCLAARTARAEYPIAENADSPVVCYRAMLAAAPVTPAGGDVEVLGYRATRVDPTGVARLDRPLLSKVKEWGPAFAIVELVDRAHVTRLQAEVEKVRNSVQAEWRKSDEKWMNERDALKAEVERLQQLVAQSRADADEADRLRHAAQSELTKAREFLGGMLFAFDDGVGRDWSAPLLDEARKFCPAVEYQSAPAVESPMAKVARSFKEKADSEWALHPSNREFCKSYDGSGWHGESRTYTCPKCGGTGEADSGGIQPWGEGINVPCDCKSAPAANEPMILVRKRAVDWLKTYYPVLCRKSGLVDDAPAAKGECDE